MMNRKMIVSLRLLGLALMISALDSKVAQADVLFIDLNFSPTEVKAAEKAASARGEKLILLPEIPAATRIRIDKLKQNMLTVEHKNEQLLARIEQARKGQIRLSFAELKRLEIQLGNSWEERSRSEQAFEEAAAKFPIDKAVLSKAFSQFPRGTSISSIVLSSHQAGGFFGTAGRLERQDLIELLKAQPQVYAGLKSLYLWGCYTATLATVKTWREELPTVQVIAGYDDRAPKGYRPASASYLHSLMTQEKKIGDKAVKARNSHEDMQRFQSAVKQLKGFSETNAAFCAADIYVNHKGATILEHLEDCPEQIYRVAEQGKREFKKYLEAKEPGYQDVPADTSRSALRDYYRHLRQNSHCRKLAKEANATTEQLIRLILFKTVAKNFGMVEQPRLRQLQELARSQAIGISIPDFSNSNVSRAQVLQTIRDLKAAHQHLESPSLSERVSSALDWLKNRGKAPSKKTEFAELARNVSNEMEQLLGNMRCTPVDWVEPASSAQRLSRADPNCINGTIGGIEGAGGARGVIRRFIQM